MYVGFAGNKIFHGKWVTTFREIHIRLWLQSGYTHMGHAANAELPDKTTPAKHI